MLDPNSPLKDMVDDCHRAITAVQLDYSEIESLLVLISRDFVVDYSHWLEDYLRLRVPDYSMDIATRIWGIEARLQLTPVELMDGKPYRVIPIIAHPIYLNKS